MSDEMPTQRLPMDDYLKLETVIRRHGWDNVLSALEIMRRVHGCPIPPLPRLRTTVGTPQTTSSKGKQQRDVTSIKHMTQRFPLRDKSSLIEGS